VPIPFLRGSLSTEVLTYLRDNCEFLTCTEAKIKSNPNFQKCIDYPSLPNHIYYEGYLHGEVTSLPVQTANPRYGTLMNKHAAPLALRALCECIRRKVAPGLLKALKAEEAEGVEGGGSGEKNETSAAAAAAAIDEGDEDGGGNPLERENEREEGRGKSNKRTKNVLVDTLIEQIEKGYAFSDLAVQIHAGDSVQGHQIGWHTDAPNSLLHMAVGLGTGLRALHTKRSETQEKGSNLQEYVDWQQPGDVYISSPSCMEHAVEYDKAHLWSNRIIAVQARFPIRKDNVKLLTMSSECSGSEYIDLMKRMKQGLESEVFTLPSLDELMDVESELKDVAAEERIRRTSASASSETVFTSMFGNGVN